MSKKSSHASQKHTDKQLRRLLKDGKTEEITEMLCKLKSDFLHLQTQDPLICCAVKNGNTEVVKSLIEKGAVINKPNHHGLMPIHIAAKEGNVDIIKLLLKHGADVQELTRGSDSALYIAVKHDQDLAVSALIEGGADVSHNSSFINNRDLPLHAAAVLPSSKILNRLLETDAEIDGLNDDNRTPLHLAALKGCHWNIKRLLSCGANPNILDSGGHTPLLLAADHNNVEVVRLLCIAGASLNVENNNWENALRKAVSNWHINVARTLLHFGADVNRAFGDGETCISITISQCRHKMSKSWGGTSWKQMPKVSLNIELEMLDTLIAAGADLEYIDKHGNPYLHTCVKSGCAPVLNYLIDNGANCLQVTSTGVTLLQYACSINATQAIQLLLQNCALLVNHPRNVVRLEEIHWEDPFHPLNISHYSPLLILWKIRNKHCLQLLFEAGYRPDLREKTFIELHTRKDKKKVDNAINFYLRQEFSNPWSLSRIARTVIREQLQVHLGDKVNKLPIPQTLRESILLIGVTEG